MEANGTEKNAAKYYKRYGKLVLGNGEISQLEKFQKCD